MHDYSALSLELAYHSYPIYILQLLNLNRSRPRWYTCVVQKRKTRMVKDFFKKTRNTFLIYSSRVLICSQCVPLSLQLSTGSHTLMIINCRLAHGLIIHLDCSYSYITISQYRVLKIRLMTSSKNVQLSLRFCF